MKNIWLVLFLAFIPLDARGQSDSIKTADQDSVPVQSLVSYDSTLFRQNNRDMMSISGKLDRMVLSKQSDSTIYLNLKWDLVKQQHLAGGQALDKMKMSSTLIGFMEELTALECEINQMSSLWSDSMLANGWDRVKDYGTFAGLTLAGVYLIENKNIKPQAGGIGLCLTGVCQLAGHIWGNNNADKLRAKIEFLNYSRRAYDDLKARNRELQLYIQSNKAFTNSLMKLEKEYYTPKIISSGNSARLADSIDAYQNVISDLKTYLGNFEIQLSQVPSYLDGIIAVNENYMEYYNNRPATKALYQNILLLNNKANKLKKKYNGEVIKSLAVSRDVRRILNKY